MPGIALRTTVWYGRTYPKKTFSLIFLVVLVGFTTIQTEVSSPMWVIIAHFAIMFYSLRKFLSLLWKHLSKRLYLVNIIFIISISTIIVIVIFCFLLLPFLLRARIWIVDFIDTSLSKDARFFKFIIEYQFIS